MGTAYDILIIGAGPAGLSAAIYGARDGYKTVIVEKSGPGGQLSTTSDVENYPGFPDGIMGPELMDSMAKQAQKFGAGIITDTVEAIDTKGPPFTVKGTEKTYTAKTVIIASGANYRKLDVPGEQEFTGRGVSYCATCDGPFFRNKDVILIGGGDAAFDEALYLSKFVKQLHIVHRRNEFRATAHLVEKAQKTRNIAFILDTVVDKIQGDQLVKAAVLRNKVTGKTSEFPAQGVFIFIGSVPSTAFLPPEIEKDKLGRVITNLDLATSVKGIFAAGDVRTRSVRQAASSAGDGVTAVLNAEKLVS